MSFCCDNGVDAISFVGEDVRSVTEEDIRNVVEKDTGIVIEETLKVSSGKILANFFG